MTRAKALRGNGKNGTGSGFAALAAAFAICASFALTPSVARAQQSSSELYAASGSTAAAAPTQGPVSVNFRANTNNPTGDTNAAIAATTPTVTARVLNQQYANATNFTTNGLMIGGTFTGDPRFTTMNFFGGAQNAHFTALPINTPGTGINVGVNHAFQLEARTAGLQAGGAPLTGRIYFADLELTFNRPVSNTVVHFAALGGGIGTGGAGAKEFSAEFDLITANSTGVTGVSLLSGNGLLSVSGNQINNTYVSVANVSPGNCGANTSACGSVRILGDAVTRVYFRVYMRSRNNTPWVAGTTNGSEGFFVGVSGQTSDMVPQLSGLPTTIDKGTTYTGLTLTCTNTGPNLAVASQCVPSASEGTVSNVSCSSALPSNVSELSGSNQISCTFDYTMPVAPSSSSINFIGQTGGANDRNGGSVLTAPNNQTTASATVRNAADLSVTKTNTPGANGNVDQPADTVITGSTTTYTITVRNNGPDTASNVLVTDTVGAGLTCPAGNTVTITGNGVPSGSFTVGDLTGAGITLNTLADGQSATLSYSCQVN